jgi:hypothetical protein
MNELHAVIAFFVLIGLLPSRMKREQRQEIAGKHSGVQGFTPAETLKSLRKPSQDSPFVNLRQSRDRGARYC